MRVCLCVRAHACVSVPVRVCMCVFACGLCFSVSHGKVRNGKERKGKERNGKERKGKDRNGEEKEKEKEKEKDRNRNRNRNRKGIGEEEKEMKGPQRPPLHSSSTNPMRQAMPVQCRLRP